jgi:hypothetical protein
MPAKGGNVMFRHMVPAAGAAAVLALALFGGVGFGPEARAENWANDQRWSVMPQPERDQPGVERAGTLRVVRFSFDGGDPWRDQGTVVGWVGAAATGTLEPRREESPEDTLLEIVKSVPPKPPAPAPAE